jgi:protein required for attachment to host cells
MPGPRTLWIVIADGEHARIVRPDAEEELRVLRSLDSASAHLRSRDIGSDRPNIGPHRDLHDLEKDRFIHLVADQLNEAAAYSEFDDLVIVALPNALQELRSALDGTTMKKLIGTLEKDLVKIPDHELSPHLREWINPAQRRNG